MRSCSHQHRKSGQLRTRICHINRSTQPKITVLIRTVISSILVWWRWGGSNSRPLHCERSALPSELHPHKGSRRVGWRRFPAVFKRSSGYEGVSTQTRRRPGSPRSSGRRTKGPVSGATRGTRRPEYRSLRCFSFSDYWTGSTTGSVASVPSG